MTEDRTPALTRAREAGYDPCVNTNQCCLNCRYSRTAEYVNGETKFVCDELSISTYKCAWCRHFNYMVSGMTDDGLSDEETRKIKEIAERHRRTLEMLAENRITKRFEKVEMKEDGCGLSELCPRCGNGYIVTSVTIAGQTMGVCDLCANEIIDKINERPIRHYAMTKKSTENIAKLMEKKLWTGEEEKE